MDDRADPYVEDDALAPLCRAWTAVIRKGQEAKKAAFGDTAEEGMRFFGQRDYDWLYSRRSLDGVADPGSLPSPVHRMTCNKVAEMVQLFGPVLYHRNPVRQVNPRASLDLPPAALQLLLPPVDPMAAMADPMAAMQQQQQVMAIQQSEQRRSLVDGVRARLLAEYLNYTPRELGLARQARVAVDEAIIKGRSCLWVETYQPPGSPMTIVGSFFDSVDDLVIDPDAEAIEECRWIARRCVHPHWEAERLYGLPAGSLRKWCRLETQASQSSADERDDWRRRRGESNDLLVYWKVYSRMGMGSRLAGSGRWFDADGSVLDELGDHCFLVVAEGCPYPLNLPPDAQAADVADPQGWAGVQARVAWPIPTYVDGDSPWPVSLLDFHDVPRSPWPMSHLKPGLGELKFLNWAYSYLAGRVRIACRQFLAIPKDTEDEIVETVIRGEDLSLLRVPVTGPQKIQDIVQVLKFDNVISDVYEVIGMVERQFERRVGLTELMYGATPEKAPRSAAEVQARTTNMNVRPDAMADRVEGWMGQAARKEALAARLYLQASDVQPVLGPVGAMLWEKLVHADSPDEAARDLEYTIESGSARKPNKDREVQNATSAMQTLFPPLFQFATASGVIGPVNALLADWCKAFDIADPSRYMLPPPPPPPPMPPPGEGPGEGGPPGRPAGPPPGARRPMPPR